MDDFKNYLAKLKTRINFIEQLYDIKNLNIKYDNLKNCVSAENELLYITLPNGEEHSGIFVFGSEFFASDLSEQEFKSKLSLNSLSFKILRAYKRIKKRKEDVKISDILYEIQDKKKDSIELDVILKKILTLAYYLNWDLQKDSQDIEGDSIIKIPDVFLQKLKQRFDFQEMCSIYENEEIFMFLNVRGKLNIVFKDRDEFTRRDLEVLIPKVMNNVFGTQECNFQ